MWIQHEIVYPSKLTGSMSMRGMEYCQNLPVYVVLAAKQLILEKG